MISGMYMGELVRCILTDLTKRRLLFGGQGSQKLFTPKSFQTAYISAIESDKKNEYILTRQALAAMDLRHATLDDCDIVKLVSFRLLYCLNIGLKKFEDLIIQIVLVI
jgi:hexokinase